MFLCLFSQRYKIACLKCEFAQFYNASRLRKSDAFEESNLCYNKYRRRSHLLYLLCKYREIHAVRRGFEYLFQHWLRKSEAFEESNQCYNKIKIVNFQGRFYWNINLFYCFFKVDLCYNKIACAFYWNTALRIASQSDCGKAAIKRLRVLL